MIQELLRGGAGLIGGVRKISITGVLEGSSPSPSPSFFTTTTPVSSSASAENQNLQCLHDGDEQLISKPISRDEQCQ